MDSEEVEFDPWGPKKFERAWVLSINLPRESINSFCAALEDVMTARRGGVFYFPNKEFILFAKNNPLNDLTNAVK